MVTLAHSFFWRGGGRNAENLGRGKPIHFGDGCHGEPASVVKTLQAAGRIHPTARQAAASLDERPTRYYGKSTNSPAYDLCARLLGNQPLIQRPLQARRLR